MMLPVGLLSIAKQHVSYDVAKIQKRIDISKISSWLLNFFIKVIQQTSPKYGFWLQNSCILAVELSNQKPCLGDVQCFFIRLEVISQRQ